MLRTSKLRPFATHIVGRATALCSLFLWAVSHGSRSRAGVGPLAPAAALRAVGSLPAGRMQFLRSHLAVTIAVEPPQDVCGLIEFLRVDPAVAIRIQGAEKTGHGSWPARALRRWCGHVLWSAIPRGTRRGIFLGAKRPSGEGECHGSGKDLSGVHRGSGLG